MNQTLTYLALGILVGYLTPYIITLIKPKLAQTIQDQKEND